MGHGESGGAVTTISSDCFPRCTSPVSGTAVATEGSLENFQANVPLESELLVTLSLQTVGSPVELEQLPSRLRSKCELQEWHLMNPSDSAPLSRRAGTPLRTSRPAMWPPSHCR